MNLIQAWVQTPLAHALGWTLAHFVWEGTLIALLVGGILRVSHSARLRYAVAVTALLTMPVVFGLTIAVSWPAAQTGSDVSIRLNPIGAYAPTSAMAEPIDERIRGSLPWLTPVWMAGVLLFYAQSLANWMAAQRMRRTGVCAAPAEWQDKLRSLANALGLRQPVTLLESCLVDVPVVTGFVRPVILVPLGLLTGFPPDHVEYILIHELAHLLRRDYVISLLQNFVEGLLFYHPAVWWISGHVRSERENCCDDAVVALRGDAH